MKKIVFFILILFSFIGCEKKTDVGDYIGSKSDGRLSGVFSVGPNRKVYFSQGNLCAHYAPEKEGSKFQYCFFFANQWETSYYPSHGAIESPIPSDVRLPNITSEKKDYWYITIEEPEPFGTRRGDGFGAAYFYGYLDKGGFTSSDGHHDYDDYNSLYYVDMFPWGFIEDEILGVRDQVSDKAGDVYEATSLNSINGDWGSCRILNGGNYPGWWRTLSIDEWEYLMFERENAESLIGLGVIGEFDGSPSHGVCGLILLPDNSHIRLKSSDKKTSFTDNQFTFEEWSTLEAKGAVFLPAASSLPLQSSKDGAYVVDWDYDDDLGIDDSNIWGCYWSSSGVVPRKGYPSDMEYAFMVEFNGERGYKYDPSEQMAPKSNKEYYMPIRLVQDVE